uniref:Smad nuclear-interacting protein 1 n=1 Tax=Kwoniella pini CBS 10737 TaxID=1296096 RepID=A0A1B9I0U7_9TREE|nr:smad nuclear-interacting protein 1 [Kwoniella pini CBS 10737]OCF49071.1 smad nuclear-interacting protein 1 [Kwoniella pini CBS 10737]
MSESPDRRHYRRDSHSPRRREYISKGQGRSSSRRRSPVPARGQDRDRDRRPRDGGYGDRDSLRDRERARDKAGYSEKEREKERAVDRKRYDGDVKREVSYSDHILSFISYSRIFVIAKANTGIPTQDPDAPLVEPEKPNFGNSGLLAKETNTIKGVEVKYNEPPEARKPTKNWRLYVFKGSEQVDLIHIYRQSCYLIGRDTVITDIPIAHPSCSKQHSAIQYRQISEKNEYGDVTTAVKPFIIDLDSTNGTYVNDVEIPKSRYYELRGSDVIKFGTSSREYVLLAEDAST